RIAAVEERASAISMHSAQEIELLRRHLGEVQTVVAAADESVGARLALAADSLRGEISEAVATCASREDLESLLASIAGSGDRIESLVSELGAFERRLEEKAAMRSAEIAALRARIEQLEGGTAQDGDSEAVETLRAQIETLGSEVAARMDA